MGNSKNTLISAHTIKAASMATSVTSPVTGIQYLDNILIQLNFTGTPTGTFAVQVSSDYAQDAQGNVITPGNWVALPLSPTPSAGGSGNQIIIDMTEIPAPYMRVVYTASSGAGSLDMYISGKAI